MNTPTQLANQIRFHLESLGESNAHHPFEQLCLGLTRRRIVSNVMPATGPVSAGGDHGRDGESYWSIIAAELPNTSLFTALATDDAVVLAVTAQLEGVPAKIRADLEKICGDGAPVERVVYFTITPVTVSKRHELQKHARDEHDIALDVWDAQAISLKLASPDLFHLAVDHLHVPSSLTPERPPTEAELPEWYVEDRSAWRDRSALAGTIGELVDLREGLRHSAYHLDARADLPDWISAAHDLRETSAGQDALLNRIDYELITATAFGMSTLLPADGLVRDLFARHKATDPDPGVVTDAITVLRVVEYLQPVGKTGITTGETAGWTTHLEQTIDRMLEAADGPNAKAQLLCAGAILAIGPADLSVETVRGLNPDDIPGLGEVFDSLSEARRSGQPLPAAPGDGGVRDLEKCMSYLSELADLLPSTPLVPIRDVKAIFDMTVPILADHPAYSAVCRALDQATTERGGLAVAGDGAQSRAHALLAAGRPIRALREIHEAKIDWLRGESAEGAAIMMLLAARVYYDLRLPLAAKQYAMSAASVARSSNDPELAVLMARGFTVAASCEHLAGQWLTATQTFRIGIWAQASLAGEPWNLERYPYFRDMLVDQCFIVRTARALRPAFLPLIEPVIQSTRLDDLTEPMLASASAEPHADEEQTATQADRGGLCRPFADAGPVRHYVWSALGVVWTVETANERAHVLAAERFAAGTQIALADLASEDLMLIPGGVTVRVEVADEPVPSHDIFQDRAETKNEAHLVTLTRASALDVAAAQMEVTIAAMQTIATQSILGRDAFSEAMERTFERGLPHMLACVRPYDELVDVHKDAFYDELRRLDGTYLAPDAPFNPEPSPDLGEQVFEQPAAGYDHDATREDIAYKYEALRAPIRLTLTKLAEEEAFMATVRELRREGWKDWHLLTAIANIVVNKRAVIRGINMTTSISKADVQRFQELMTAEERTDDPPTPIDAFSVDQMRFHLANAASATARRWGLEVRVPKVEPHALLRTLDNRFNYLSDDVEHPVVLPET